MVHVRPGLSVCARASACDQPGGRDPREERRGGGRTTKPRSHSLRSSAFFLLKAMSIKARSSLVRRPKGKRCLAMSPKYFCASRASLVPSPLKYLIFHPRPSSVSRFHASYSGMVKNETSFLALVTLTMGVMNSTRKLGSLRSDGNQ